MSLTRRQFVILTSASLVVGCQANDGDVGNSPLLSPLLSPHDVDCGPATRYTREGVYAAFRDQGVYLVRQRGEWLALSSICTHRNCEIQPADAATYLCSCHGSTFDAGGHVTKGPAQKDLPRFATSIDGRGHLIVHVATPATAS